MSIISASDLALGFLSAAPGTTSYSISRSLRFNSSDSAYLSRTPASAGNRKTWTWSGWVKRSNPGSRLFLFSANPVSSAHMSLSFLADDRLMLIKDGGGSTQSAETVAVFRDPGAWLHIIVVFDAADGTAANRAKIYVNGTQQTLTNTYGTFNNVDYPINATTAHGIGWHFDAATNFYSNGYLAEIHFIDGQALDPSSFVETSATTGQLIPKQYTGSFGTNGFWLKFSDNSAATATTLGKDYSGNSNNWTPNNLSVADGTVLTSGGALPIYNTTDSYGNTKGSGTRTDANSTSIVLAVPMDGTNNGTSFSDLSATIKGSGSAKTITTIGDAKTSTTRSKYYGSSGLFDGTGDYLSVAASSDLQLGAGDFCIELWWYPTSTSRQALYHGSIGTDWSIGIDYNSVGTQKLGIWASSNGTSWNMINADGGGNGIGTITVPQNQWNHIAYTRSGNTFRLFVNGVQDIAVTASGTIIDRSGSAAAIGSWWNTGAMAQATGSIQDFCIYKGAAKYTANFSVPNYLTGAGFDTPVDTPTSYGTDDSLGGSVRGNYATWNPLNIAGGALANGNLDLTNTGGGRKASTFAVSSGKWYWEVSVTSAGDAMIGTMPAANPVSTGSGNFVGGAANEYGYYQSANKYTNGTATSYGATFGNGDVIGVALDLDAGTLVYYKNGVSQGTAFTGITGTYTPAVSAGGSSGASMTANFGQRPFAYTAPSGFKALVDTNLPAPTIVKPSTAFDVKLYTGNGSTQTISGLGFSPDLVWIKCRVGIRSHVLFDQVRGTGAALKTNTTAAEASPNPDGIVSAFTSDGFTVTGGSSANVETNNLNDTLVAWTWDAGTSTVTNTSGTISAQVRANASAGFSIVSYTGNSSTTATVGHGLGAAPALIICKNRSDAGESWAVYHSALGATKTLLLNTTDAPYTLSGFWQNTAPTSSVVTIGEGGGYNNKNGKNHIMYCFAPVAGYSSFGSYTGNGSFDGPFIYTGFRPKFILVKNASVSGAWEIYDSVRNPYNVMALTLLPNAGDAEITASNGVRIDFTSNGFKWRDNGSSINGSGNTIIWAAFAENPFNYARAR